jgi:hypothetical protein
MRRILSIAAVATAGVLLAVMPAIAPANARKGPHVCQGTPTKPGVLKGKYSNGVNVKGYCFVNAGPAHVIGTLTVTNGSVFIAAFGKAHSALTVTGDLIADTDSTVVLGCNPQQFPCVDDPASSNPSIKATLSSAETVTGDLTSSMTLGVIVHSTSIGGNVTQTLGGGGASCATPTSGPFAAFHSPVYSTYEDTKVGGNLTVTRVTSCWLGIVHNHVTKNVTLTHDQMADPDAIEVLSNKINENLVCKNDSPTLWDSSEKTFSSLYPRKLARNNVLGQRIGSKCQKAGPLTQGGPPAGGAF